MIDGVRLLIIRMSMVGYSSAVCGCPPRVLKRQTPDRAKEAGALLLRSIVTIQTHICGEPNIMQSRAGAGARTGRSWTAGPRRCSTTWTSFRYRHISTADHRLAKCAAIIFRPCRSRLEFDIGRLEPVLAALSFRR